ncbi:hypothetical protein PIB30_056380 [Stylosanthes scabra]|uniref:Uncharacterized protein n=1 Tax=Stylosanthes scabra TaxID=79078 RepID=A0ABU6UJ79_9FABA|nr:hypothetical protein [Stylosanthes scabra]
MALYRSKTPEIALQQCLEETARDAGMAFKYTLVGGSIFHFFNGLCRSPNGARLAGPWHAMGVNGPRVAGKCGAWFGISAAIDNALGYGRQKDDHWNHIASSTIATGLLSMHRGIGATARFASLAAVLSAVMEVCLPLLSKYSAELDDRKGKKDGCAKCSKP